MPGWHRGLERVLVHEGEVEGGSKNEGVAQRVVSASRGLEKHSEKEKQRIDGGAVLEKRCRTRAVRGGRLEPEISRVQSYSETFRHLFHESAYYVRSAGCFPSSLSLSPSLTLSSSFPRPPPVRLFHSQGCTKLCTVLGRRGAEEMVSGFCVAREARRVAALASLARWRRPALVT